MPLLRLRAPFVRIATFMMAAILLLPAAGRAQTVSCAVQDTGAQSDAAQAYEKHNYALAETLYRSGYAAKPSAEMAAGLSRSLLHQGKLPDALTTIQTYLQGHPNDSLALTVLGEVQFRRGDVAAAIAAINNAAASDPCNGVAHYDASRVLDSVAMFASGYKQLQLAYNLAPNNPMIATAWARANPAPGGEAAELAMLQKKLADATLTPDQRSGTETAIKMVQTHQKGDCQAVGNIQKASLPLLHIQPYGPQGPVTGVGLDIKLNGRGEHFQIDTGASGITVSRSAAKDAGLTPEVKTSIGGIGDQGASGGYVTHVDDIRIGNLEFHNCVVEVVEGHDRLDVAGLIGTDVFSNYQITLDVPSSRLVLAPLPPRPGETAAVMQLNTEEQGYTGTNATRKDRYIAPEMKDWTRVLRIGHQIIVPTRLNDGPPKLFILDTGAESDLIAPSAAREVTHVGKSEDQIMGISGQVKQTFTASDVTIQFARVKKHIHYMSSIDTTAISNNSGLEISGFLGYDTLRDLVLGIDYRDNLINVVYDPNHGIHSDSPDNSYNQ